MRTFFRFIRNIFLLALLAFGVWTYKNNPDFQIATNDSLVTLSYRINQLLTMGTATAPKNGINSNTKTNTDKTENDNSSETRVWSKPEANVYVDIKNDLQLRSAAIDAMNAWNRTSKTAGMHAIHMIMLFAVVKYSSCIK